MTRDIGLQPPPHTPTRWCPHSRAPIRFPQPVRQQIVLPPCTRLSTFPTFGAVTSVAHPERGTSAITSAKILLYQVIVSAFTFLGTSYLKTFGLITDS